MQSTGRQLRLAAAVISMAALLEAGVETEKRFGVDCYYRQLGAKQAHLSPLKRVLLSVLLATKDQLTKQKRQA